MTPRQRILAAFWHRGRKCFVPLLGAEIERRSGYQPEHNSSIRELIAERRIEWAYQGHGNSNRTYTLTPAGQAEALQAMGVMG